jgi:hypothetical protein
LAKIWREVEAGNEWIVDAAVHRGVHLNLPRRNATKPLWAINGKTVARRLAHETGSDR